MHQVVSSSTINDNLPEEHKDEMSYRAPPSRNDFEPCMRARSIKLQLGCELMVKKRHLVIFCDNHILTDLRK